MNRIREARKAKRLTLKELGQLVGVGESTVSMYENAKRQPDNATLVRISNVLEVSVDYLLGKDDALAAMEIQKQPAAQSSELDNELVSMLTELTPAEVLRVLDFVEGLKAARKVQPSQNP